MHDARVSGLADDLATLLRRHFECVDAVQPGAGDIRAIGILVRQRRAITPGIPLLAVDDAGVATDADIEIDDQPELFSAAFGGKAGHDDHSCP